MPSAVISEEETSHHDVGQMEALLAYRHHLQTQPPQAGMARTEPPGYARRLALQPAVSWQSIAPAFALQGGRRQAALATVH
jgi:hypothetical protein